MACNRVEELLEAYTLGALDADERLEVEQHLAGCLDCRRLADALATAAAQLPLALSAASPTRPPQGLRDRVLGAVTAQPTASDAPAVAASKPAAEGAAGPPSLAVSRWPAWRRARALAAVAVAALLVLALVWGARLSEALDRERALRQQVEEIFTQQQELVLEVVDSEQTQRVVLVPPEGSDFPTRPYGKLFTRLDMPHVVAMVARLPAPPEGQRYHLWLTGEGRTFLAGVLTINDQGFGLLTFDADRNGPTYDAALLTLQSPGDTAPAGETVLAWSTAGSADGQGTDS